MKVAFLLEALGFVVSISCVVNCWNMQQRVFRCSAERQNSARKLAVFMSRTGLDWTGLGKASPPRPDRIKVEFSAAKV